MYYTLSDFISECGIPELEQISGTREHLARQIDSASVQEMPVDDFIRPNELVISTAAGCLENTNLLRELIAGVGRARAAALILAFKDQSFRMSESLISFANNLELPIFIIPWEYRFADIVAGVLNRVKAKKTEHYQLVQTGLFNMYFEFRPLSSAAERIANEFASEVVITDKECGVQGAYSLDGADNAEGAVLTYEKARERGYTGYDIAMGDAVTGFLYMKARAGTELGQDEELVKRCVCFPLTMWFNQERIENMMEAKFKNDFVWNLATGNFSSMAEMVRLGERLNFDLNKPYTCIVLRVVMPEASAPQPYSLAVASVSAVIESIIQETGRAHGIRVMYADRSLEFVLYAENPALDATGAVERFIADIEGRLSRETTDCTFYWGISDITRDIHDFQQIYKNASLALQYCMSSKSGKYSFTYRDTKEARVISAISENKEIHDMAESMLKALLDYDSESNINLLGTLTEFIRCNYHINDTARELHIHRQSLLYRLQKIENLTGMSLKEHKDLFLLEIATRILVEY